MAGKNSRTAAGEAAWQRAIEVVVKAGYAHYDDREAAKDAARHLIRYAVKTRELPSDDPERWFAQGELAAWLDREGLPHGLPRVLVCETGHYALREPNVKIKANYSDADSDIERLSAEELQRRYRELIRRLRDGE